MRLFKFFIAIIVIILSGFYLFVENSDFLFDQEPLATIKTDGPGGLACDEFKEIYHVLNIRYHSVTDTGKLVLDYVMPYPNHNRDDTTYFYRYYGSPKRKINSVVYLVGRFHGSYWAGGENRRYGCQDIAHFEIYKIYDEKGGLIIDFDINMK